MNTSIITQKQNVTPIIKPLSMIVVGFTITQMALMGMFFSQSAVIVGYILIFSGVFPLALKDKIIQALTKWLKIYSIFLQSNVVNIINVEYTKHIIIQNSFYTYNNSTSNSTSSTTINNIQYYQSDILENQDKKLSTMDSFLSVIKNLHDNNIIILSDNVLKNLENLQYSTTNKILMQQTELAIGLSFFEKLKAFKRKKNISYKKLAVTIATNFELISQKIKKGSFYNIYHKATSLSDTELNSSIREELKQTIHLLLKSN